ncbi:AAA family ATPase [Egicoccus sp. AB-alg2]|uniref:helix-turn-helix transcriptional regulator n=1 Tax=Egicoccus sp. AB-alg2 TaxID=3242693 RepID=UPI00359DE242
MKLRGRDAEREALGRLLADVLAGHGGVAVIRGEAGVGKSALLGHVADRVTDWQVTRARGVEAEREFTYGGLHQLCAPLADGLERLPSPQRQALATVFGRVPGAPPEPFLVALATLTLFGDAAARRPLACIVDDVHWFDPASVRVLGFVARRLAADRVAVVCAARTGSGDDVLAGCPELVVRALQNGEARALLMDHVHGRLDAAVCERMVDESHANPGELLKLPRFTTVEELAGGFGLPNGRGLVERGEQSYTRRLLALSPETRLFLLAAAAEPVGDPVMVHRAAERLGIAMNAVAPALDAGLLELGQRVRFAHPLARSAAYHGADAADRCRVHRALAEVTDGEQDPDRRAWHRAHAVLGPDEQVAAELERSAQRAQHRAGLAAAAALLARAATLTVDPARRAVRALAAAEVKFEAGASDAALVLLSTVPRQHPDALPSVRAEQLDARIRSMCRGDIEASTRLLHAARCLEPLDAESARDAYLDAFAAGVRVGGGDGVRALRDVAEAARAAPDGAGGRRARDWLVDGLALRFTDGYTPAVPALQCALRAFRKAPSSGAGAAGPCLVAAVAHEVWDDQAWHSLAERAVQVARERGALAALPMALEVLADARLHSGRLDDAATLLDEAAAIREATGARTAHDGRLLLEAWRCDEPAMVPSLDAGSRDVSAAARGRLSGLAEYANAVLHNGLADHDTAYVSAQRACEHEQLGLFNWALSELVEAAVRTGRRDTAADANGHLETRVGAVTTEWALGMRARARALLSGSEAAESHYRESLERLGRCRVTLQRARTQLLYGEWLRRENRRLDARRELRAAFDYFDQVGAHGFAERARHELLATGEKIRKRGAGTRELTAQEEHVARLAAEGMTNSEIGGRLFLSPRTVEWHLRNVFGKLGVDSRRALRAHPDVLHGDVPSALDTRRRAMSTTGSRPA